MGTLCDHQLEHLCERFDLVSPYDSSLINPASIDLRVGMMARLERWYGKMPAHDDELWGGEFSLDQGGGYLLRKGESILLDTLEYVRISFNHMAEMWLKSSAGRNGGDMYKAGYIDPGFHGTLTFRYRNDMKRPILVRPGIRLVQMVVREMSEAPTRPYTETGHYGGQVGPTPARGL